MNLRRENVPGLMALVSTSLLRAGGSSGNPSFHPLWPVPPAYRGSPRRTHGPTGGSLHCPCLMTLTPGLPQAFWRTAFSKASAFSLSFSIMAEGLQLSGLCRGGNSARVCIHYGDERAERREGEESVRAPALVAQIAGDIRILERIGPQIVKLREAQRDKRLLPRQQSFRALLHEMALPHPIPDGHQVAFVAPVEDARPRVLLPLRPFKNGRRL